MERQLQAALNGLRLSGMDLSGCSLYKELLNRLVLHYEKTGRPRQAQAWKKQYKRITQRDTFIIS